MLVTSLLGVRHASAWLSVFDQTADRGLQYARAVGVDASGDVIVAGTTRQPSGFTTTRWFTVCKLSGVGGSVVWCLDGVGGIADGLAIDAGGDVIASGSISSDGYSNGSFGVLRIAGDTGRAQWVRAVTLGGDPQGDHARGVALSGDNVYATGTLTRKDPVSQEKTGGFVAVRFNAADGTESTPSILAALGSHPRRGGEGRAITADLDGGAIIAGVASDDTRHRQQDVAIAKVSDEGPVWQARLQGSHPRTRRQPGRRNPTLGFLASSFQLEFVEALPADEPTIAELGDAVAVGPSGSVFVSGYVQNRSTGRDLLVARLDPSNGHEMWRRTLDGGHGGFDRAFAVSVDPAGDVVAAGYLAASRRSATDFAVVKIDGSSGVVKWVVRLGGTLRDRQVGINRAFAVTTDNAGDIVAIGVTTNRRSLRDWIIVKLSGADGRVQWCDRLNGGRGKLFTDDLALSVAVDRNGDVVGAGSLGGRLAVAKVRGDTGKDFQVEPMLAREIMPCE